MLNVGSVRVKQEGEGVFILFSERNTSWLCTHERNVNPASYTWDGFLLINVSTPFRNSQCTQIASTASYNR